LGSNFSKLLGRRAKNVAIALFSTHALSTTRRISTGDDARRKFSSLASRTNRHVNGYA
jgi:hypothetical protein